MAERSKMAESKQESKTRSSLPEHHPDVSGADPAAPCPFLTPTDLSGKKSAQMPPSNNSKIPLMLYLIIILDIYGVGLVIPLLSVFAKKLGGGPLFYGILDTTYGICQLLGASFGGSISDKYGRRPVFLASAVGAAVGYSLLFLAVAKYNSLWLLFASRIPIGLAKQTMTMSRAIVSDCSASAKQRIQGQMYVGVAATVGFIFGPMTGGILSSRNPTLPPLIAVGIFSFEFFLAQFLLPETAPLVLLKRRQQVAQAAGERAAAPEGGDTASPLANLATVAANPRALRMLLAMMAVDLPYLMMHSSFAVYSQEKFSLTPKQTGFTLAYVGVVSVVVGVCAGKLYSRLARCIRYFRSDAVKPEYYLCLFGAAVIAVSLACVGCVSTQTWLLIVLAPLAAGKTLYSTASVALLNDCVTREHNGALHGTKDAATAVCRVLAPVTAGLLMETVSLESPWLVGGTAAVFGSIALAFVCAPITPVKNKTE